MLSGIVNNKIDMMLAEAYEYVENENYSEALVLYNLVLKKEPDNISALVDKEEIQRDCKKNTSR